MKIQIIEDELGFKTLKNKPSKEELKKYYSEKYYNQEKNYKQTYSQEEISYKKKQYIIELFTTLGTYVSYICILLLA